MPPKTKKSSPRNPAAPDPQRARAISLGRHARKCCICNHPDRETIDDEFIRWRDADSIRCEYFLPDRSCLYRHAKALGLIARRRRNLRGVAERILEHVDNASTTAAAAVLRAMRLFAHISENGEWLEPPKHTIVTHIYSYALPGEASAAVAAAVASSTNVPAPATQSVATSLAESPEFSPVVYPRGFVGTPPDAPSQNVASAPGSFAEFSDALRKRSDTRPSAVPATPPQNERVAPQPQKKLQKKPRGNQQPVTSNASSSAPNANPSHGASLPAQTPSAPAAASHAENNQPAHSAETPASHQPPAPSFVTYRIAPNFPRRGAGRFGFPTEVTVPISKNAAEFASAVHQNPPAAPNPSENNSLPKPKRPFQKVILIATPNPSRESAND